MNGPVYAVPRSHNFPGDGARNGGLKEGGTNNTRELQGPVYGIQHSSHSFQETSKSSSTPRSLVGPVFKVARDANFHPKEVKVKGELLRSAPVYRGVIDRNEYHPRGDGNKVDHEAKMFSPKFPVEAHNSYTPPSPPKVTADKLMAYPHYRGIEGISSRNSYSPNETIQTQIRPMFAPKLLEDDVSHHYGPIEMKRDLGSIDGMPGPVYCGGEGGNSYAVVEERRKGETVMSFPKLPNVDSHNNYSPVGDRVDNPTSLAGPVFKGVEADNKYHKVL